MDLIKDTVATLNSLSPLAIIGGLVYVIYHLIQQRRETSKSHAELTSNHLHELPDIADTLRRIEQKQDATSAALLGQFADVRESLAHVKAKLNGK